MKSTLMEANHETSRSSTAAAHYTISGGQTFGHARGQYNKLGASRTCDGKPVYSYKYDCGWFCSDTTYYLYLSAWGDGSMGDFLWMVGDEGSLNDCGRNEDPLLVSTFLCADDPSGSGCAGTWQAGTGKTTDYAECNNDWYCTEPGLTVV